MAFVIEERFSNAPKLFYVSVWILKCWCYFIKVVGLSSSIFTGNLVTDGSKGIEVIRVFLLFVTAP